MSKKAEIGVSIAIDIPDNIDPEVEDIVLWVLSAAADTVVEVYDPSLNNIEDKRNFVIGITIGFSEVLAEKMGVDVAVFDAMKRILIDRMQERSGSIDGGSTSVH